MNIVSWCRMLSAPFYRYASLITRFQEAHTLWKCPTRLVRFNPELNVFFLTHYYAHNVLFHLLCYVLFTCGIQYKCT